MHSPRITHGSLLLGSLHGASPRCQLLERECLEGPVGLAKNLIELGKLLPGTPRQKHAVERAGPLAVVRRVGRRGQGVGVRQWGVVDEGLN